jgi:hypothetical protein
MPRRIALKDYIAIDHQDLSTFGRSVSFTSTDDRIDASGFNATGANTFLAGQRVQEFTVEFMMARGTNEVHPTLYPLHRDRSTFDIVWRADVNSAASATNPELRGHALLPEYSEGATRGELETASFTFVTADDTGFVFYET